jgi:uncharacterized SAM-binding protein YcdF (DUF218 family)
LGARDPAATLAQVRTAPAGSLLVIRGAALGAGAFLGAFAAANALGGALRPGFDANALWLPGTAPAWLVGPAALGLLGWGLRALLRRDAAGARPRVAAAAGAAGAAAACLALPLLLMVAFGRVDHRAPADAIVVFGARAYADGRASVALADRVRTGVELYHAGLAPRLVLSGGPGDGAHHEVDVMRDLALAADVPPAAIELDHTGHDTAATVWNLRARLAGEEARRVLAVSHGYHLPRVALTCARAGLDARTVPARQERPLGNRRRLVARETAAFWVYWAQPGRGRVTRSDDSRAGRADPSAGSSRSSGSGRPGSR